MLEALVCSVLDCTGLFLKHAASLLRSNNMFIMDTPQELTLPDESSRIELVEKILLTLSGIQL